MAGDVKKIRQALMAIQEAQDVVAATVCEEYPAGAEIWWWFNEHKQFGFVLRQEFMTGRLFVENAGTGAKYLIQPHQIAEPPS